MYKNKLDKYLSKIEDLTGGKRNRINKINEKKLLGDGSYGCIISPPLKCRGDPEKPKQPSLVGLSELEKRDTVMEHIEKLKEYTELYRGQVSKIMDRRHAEKEYAETRILAALDPEYKYFAYPNKICLAETNQLRKNNGHYIDAFGSCDAEFQDNDANLHLLYSNYSGKRILKQNLNPSEILKLLIGLENILNGVNILHANNLVHMDIKSDNVLTQKKDGNVVSHMIDFGLIIHIPDLFERLFGYTHLTQTNYFIWPIELKYISVTGTLTINDTPDEIDAYIAQILSIFKLNNNYNNIQAYVFDKGVPKNMYQYSDNVNDPIYGIRRFTPDASILLSDDTLADLLKNTYMYFNTSEIIAWKRTLDSLDEAGFRATKLMPGSPEYILYSKVLKGVDIYSIGILFAQVYAKYVGQIKTILPNYLVYKNYELRNFKLVRVEIPPALIPYLNRLFDELTIPFTDFCHRCMQLNFMKRIDAPTALAEFQALIPRFDILKDPNFDKLCEYRGMIF